MNVYPFIEAERAQQRSVKRACELLEVSRAAYYAHRADRPSIRQQVDEELTEHIRQAHEASKGRYGAPRIHAQLRRLGRRHGRKRVARLMRAAGLHGRTPRRCKRTTIPDPAAAARADLIRRDVAVNAAAVNTRWCGDITYIPTWEGWLYLATVIDIASRRVVGFALAEHLRTELVADALTNAIATSIVTLPELLRRSLTWDQGAEMAQHAQLRIDTGLQVFFCDPHSPWQRGTNENTNGLLRQYFPKGTDLSNHSADDLAAVAAALNSRPRKTLEWSTPAEALDELLSHPSTAGGVATTP